MYCVILILVLILIRVGSPKLFHVLLGHLALPCNLFVSLCPSMNTVWLHEHNMQAKGAGTPQKLQVPAITKYHNVRNRDARLV